jgi:hypothetical protein
MAWGSVAHRKPLTFDVPLPHHALELDRIGEGCARVLDLMRCLAGAMFGIDSKRPDHHPIDAWVRLSELDLRRLDDVIEQRHHLGNVERSGTLASDAVGWKVSISPARAYRVVF